MTGRLLLLAALALSCSRKTAPAPDPRPDESEAFPATADALLTIFDADRHSGEVLYNKRVIDVTGTVEIAGERAVVLRAKVYRGRAPQAPREVVMMSGVRCRMADGEPAPREKRDVTVRGRCLGLQPLTGGAGERRVIITFEGCRVIKQL